MNKYIVFLLMCISLTGKTQSDSLDCIHNRFFFNFTPTFGMYKPSEKKSIISLPGGGVIYSNYPDYGGGLELSTGNNWYLRKGKFCGIVRLTWLRVGLLFSDGLYSFASPINLGIGNHFHFGQKLSMDATINGGVLFVMDDILNVTGFVNYFVMPEVKLNIGEFAIGFEYSMRPDNNEKNNTVVGHYHYFGLSIGAVFEEIK